MENSDSRLKRVFIYKVSDEHNKHTKLSPFHKVHAAFWTSFMIYAFKFLKCHSKFQIIKKNKRTPATQYKQFNLLRSNSHSSCNAAGS